MITKSLGLNIRTHREELVADETGTHKIINMRREHIKPYL